MRECSRPIRVHLIVKWRELLCMIEALGANLFYFIILVEHGVKGFLFGGGSGGVVGLPILFLLQSYTGSEQLNAVQIQLYRTVALTPWSLKSLIGMITDTIYIGGYNKVPYLFGVTIYSVLSCIILASSWPLDPKWVTCLLFFMFMGCALPDLLTEAKYSEKISRFPEYGPDITVFVWTGIFACQILSTILIGVLLEYVEPHWLYYIPVLPLTLMLYPIYHNWIGDTLHTNKSNADSEYNIGNNGETLGGSTIRHSPVPEYVTNCCCSKGWFHITPDTIGNNLDDEEIDIYTSTGRPLPEIVVEDESYRNDIVLTPLIGINLGKIKREWKAFLLATFIGLVSIITSVMAICQVHTMYLCIVSIVGTIGMIISFHLLVDQTTARIQTFVMIQNMFTISISSAEFFFFTDNAVQYPEGPHFSKKFYVTVMGVVGSVCFIIGSLTYQGLMKHWKYRSVFLFNNSIAIVVGLLNVVLYKRWNLAIGIPDEMFVLGAETFQIIIGAWTSIPVTTMMSQLCPRGMEATMFAILAGSSNLGASLAQYTGAYMLEWMHINPSGNAGESKQFENLWKASLIATLLPVVTIVTIFFLIPDRYQTEDLLDRHNDKVYAKEEGHDDSFEAVDAFINSCDEDTFGTMSLSSSSGE